MSAVRTATEMLPDQKRGRRLIGLRKNSFAIVIMILVQYGLGMGVNLYVSVPGSDQGSGIWTAIGKSVSSAPVILALHAAFGLLFVIAGTSVLVRAIRARKPLTIVTSVLGLLCLLGAGFSGAEFVNKGDSTPASMAMAMLTGVAVLCYLVNLIVIRPPQPAGRGS